MHLNANFKEPLEFARLMQTVPEVNNVVKALIGLQYYLEKNDAADGFEATIMGFKITRSKGGSE